MCENCEEARKIFDETVAPARKIYNEKVAKCKEKED
jgi:hypothetical protein